MIDLSQTTTRTREVAVAIDDSQLTDPTPADMPVRQVIHHLIGLSEAFRDAARKVDGPHTSAPPQPVDAPLPDDWRSQVADALDELADAWRSEEAWTGMTRAGGLELPGEIGGLVALDEVLLHGWDLARATGQDYSVADAEAEAVLPIVTPPVDDPTGADREGLFGPVVLVPDDAPLFDRVLGMAGRDPNWTP